MQNRLLFVLLFLSLGIAAPLQAQVERVLSLDDSVALGIQNNQDLLSFKEQAAIAQQRVSEAISQIYPKIDFNFSISQFHNALPTVLTPSFNCLYLPPENRDIYYATRVSLWQYLYNGGRYTTTLRLAEINLSQAQTQADIARNKAVVDVKNAYYDCKILDMKIAAYERALADIAAVKSPGAAGRWVSSSAHFKAELLQLHHERDKALLRYLDTVGLELNTTVELSGELTVPQEVYDYNKCIAWAFQYRPELRQTQFQETIDSLRVNLSLSERYPTVTLGANYELANDRFPMEETNWNATININVPIFDGWASLARLRQRRYQAREGRIRRAKIEDQIRYEVRDACLDYAFWAPQAAAGAGDLSSLDPEKRLEAALFQLDVLQHSLSSQANVEWAIGKHFFK